MMLQAQILLWDSIVTDGPVVRNVRNPLKLNSAKKAINIGTWNVRSLLGTGNADLLVNEMNRLGWDIVGLAELRWKGQCVLNLKDGCKILFSGANEQGQAGVGFVLSDNAYQSMLSFHAINERIISIRCRGQGPNITLIQVYAPTSSYSDEDIEDFYSTLQGKLA